MNTRIGVRREDINQWERRTPLVPEHVRFLHQEHGIDTVVQHSEIRAFADEDYARAGAHVQEDLSSAALIFGIKEIPPQLLEEGKTYVFFAHVIKGQRSNMPMLKEMLRKKCQLIDYEKVVDDRGRRLIFFGRFAGLAGMIDSLWAFGRRLRTEGMETPFTRVRQAYQYADLLEAKREISSVGDQIKAEGLPNRLVPLVCGFAGYGNVSQGAQEIFDLLPFQEISPHDLLSLSGRQDLSPHFLYKVVFREEDMVSPLAATDQFQLQDYYDHPEKYRSVFHDFLPHLTIVVNGAYWDQRYPRLMTKADLRRLYAQDKGPRLRVVGDVSCDVDGGVEFTVKATDPGNPVYVYNPLEDTVQDGWEGAGPVVMAVYNLPCELARESSAYFSQILKGFVPEIVRADYSGPLEACRLPAPIKRALIVYQGELTPDYCYLEKHL